MAVGASLAAAYFYALQKTAFRASPRTIASGYFWVVGGFFLRLSFFVFIVFCLAWYSGLHISVVVLGFMAVFLVLLFLEAGKIIFSGLKSYKERPARQPVRRI